MINVISYDTSVQNFFYRATTRQFSLLAGRQQPFLHGIRMEEWSKSFTNKPTPFLESFGKSPWGELRACLWRSSFATITFQVGSDSSPSQMQEPLPSPHPRSFVSQWQDNLVRRQPNLQQWPINGSFPSGKFAESSQPNLVHAEKKHFRLEKAKKKLAHFDKIPVWVPKKNDARRDGNYLSDVSPRRP